MTNPPPHPLAPLAGGEITRARQIVADSGRTSIPAADVRYAYVGLCEPPKDLVRAFDRGEDVAVDRRVRLQLLQGPEANVTEAIVSVTRGEGDLRGEGAGGRPGLPIDR